MRLSRFFVDQPLSLGQHDLPEAQAHYIGRVLRHATGDAVQLFDGSGREYLGELVEVGKKNVRVELREQFAGQPDSPLRIHLGQGLSRGERMDWAIQKATELGVAEITPIVSERCEVRLKDERADKRLQHWRQVAISACEQCGRSSLPLIHPPLALEDWLRGRDDDLRLVLHPVAAPLASHAPPSRLAPASAYICLEHAEHLAPGLAIARLPGEDSRDLLDLRQWPRLQRLPDGAEETQGALLCRASSADGLHAWVRMTRSGSPYAWLHRSRDLASLTPELPPLPLPPAQSLRQRRTPELAIGLAGNDLLLADRGLFFLYPGFAQGNDEPRLLFDVPQARRSIENPPAVFTTPDQRVCLLSRGQFFEWREARIQPLPFPVGKDLPADPAQPTSAAPGTIVWLERETLCEGRLDSGEIRSHSLDGLAEGPYLKLQALDGGWLLLAPWLEPHRSRDLAQLWHLESGRALRIRYGELDLEGGLQHWAELPDGRIVVGDHARHVDLGRFESLRQRLLRRRLAPA